jgi:hypothetical protein
LVFNYTAPAALVSGNPTTWTPASGFDLLDADICETNDAGFPHATQELVKTTAGSVTPSITSTGDTVDTFNSVTLALKSASGGGSLPSGIYLRKVMACADQSPPSPDGVLTFQFPATGNLRVLSTANASVYTIASVKDTDNTAYTATDTFGQIWYSLGNTADTSNKITITNSGSGPGGTYVLLDVMHATAFDVAGTAGLGCSSVASIADDPDITPTHANGLVIVNMADGQGPVKAVTSPFASASAAGFHPTTYSGELDTDLMWNADGYAAYYNPSTAAENWTWTIASNANNSCSADAAAFH